MSEQYFKLTHGYFPDFADRTITLVHPVTGVYSKVVTKDILSNPMKWSNQLLGVRNPSWRDQVRHGADATTPMTASSQKVDARRVVIVVNTSDTAGVYGNYKEYRWEGYTSLLFPSAFSPPSAILSEARNLALRKFFQRVNAARTSVEGGQALGEWKETVHAITNPLATLRKFTIKHVLDVKKRLKRLKRLNSKDPKVRRGVRTDRASAIHAALADTYLEFVFGWVPLAGDIKAAIAGLLDRYNHPDYQRVKAKGDICYGVDDGTDNVFNSDSIFVTQNWVTQYSVNYRYIASVKTGAVNGVQGVAATLGLLPERFIPTVWELIPYSFVVDYFANIGQIVEAYAFRRSVINWGVRTVRVKAEKVYKTPRLEIIPPIADYYPKIRHLNQMGAYGGGATLTSESVDRVPISQDTLMPDLDIHLPISKKPWVNMGAIITRQFVSL
jgi:hypothetical protein